MSQSISILMTGLDFDWGTGNRGDEFDIEVVRKTVTQDLEMVSKVDGLQLEVFYINPDNPSSLAELMKRLKDGHGGTPWDGCMIGAGLRADGSLSSLFEAVVNTIRESSPKTKILFNGAMTDHFETVQRNFPHLRKAA